jgi:hypothetical protein
MSDKIDHVEVVAGTTSQALMDRINEVSKKWDLKDIQYNVNWMGGPDNGYNNISALLVCKNKLSFAGKIYKLILDNIAFIMALIAILGLILKK